MHSVCVAIALGCFLGVCADPQRYIPPQPLQNGFEDVPFAEVNGVPIPEGDVGFRDVGLGSPVSPSAGDGLLLQGGIQGLPLQPGGLQPGGCSNPCQPGGCGNPCPPGQVLLQPRGPGFIQPGEQRLILPGGQGLLQPGGQGLILPGGQGLIQPGGQGSIQPGVLGLPQQLGGQGLIHSDRQGLPQQSTSPDNQEQKDDQLHILFPAIRQERQDSLSFGSCIVVLTRECPHEDVQYFLYTRQHPDVPQAVRIGADPGVSNISDTSFNISNPTKIIIHGYNSDMYLNALVEIKNQYLINDNFNVFAVDWSPMAQGPCYPAAVWNARFAGRCSSLLVERLREIGVTDIHVLGFSLGAHVSAFMANHLQPYKVPRITGLDPALPGFTTTNNAAKLDPSDADYVDVIHTNVFVQGKVEQCGHVDFYVNGGVIQPGCWADRRFFACNHHRAPFYFAESINSPRGFYGWPCLNYLAYVLGRCPPQEPQTLMGEYIDKAISGMYLVITDSVAPFAVGKFDGPTIDILLRQYDTNRMSDLDRYRAELENCPDDQDEAREVLTANNNRQLRPGFIDDYFDHIVI